MKLVFLFVLLSANACQSCAAGNAIGDAALPTAVHCASAVAPDVKEAVRVILAGGGDVGSQLLAAGVRFAKDALMCAVQFWASQQAAPSIAADPTTTRVHARAQAFLLSSGTKFE